MTPVKFLGYAGLLNGMAFVIFGAMEDNSESTGSLVFGLFLIVVSFFVVQEKS